MEFFPQAPYNLVQGDLIVAIVRAQNEVGWSQYSSENSVGQTVETTPLFAPEPLQIDFANTDEY